MDIAPPPGTESAVITTHREKVTLPLYIYIAKLYAKRRCSVVKSYIFFLRYTGINSIPLETLLGGRVSKGMKIYFTDNTGMRIFLRYIGIPDCFSGKHWYPGILFFYNIPVYRYTGMNGIPLETLLGGEEHAVTEYQVLVIDKMRLKH